MPGSTLITIPTRLKPDKAACGNKVTHRIQYHKQGAADHNVSPDKGVTAKSNGDKNLHMASLERSTKLIFLSNQSSI